MVIRKETVLTAIKHTNKNKSILSFIEKYMPTLMFVLIFGKSILFFCEVLGTEPRVSYLVGKCSTIELHP